MRDGLTRPLPEGNGGRHRPLALWSPLLAPGKLALVSGQRGVTRAFNQELAYYAVHEREGAVLWCDGDHGFDPYQFAELNLSRGYDAEWGADRVLIKRCMTPFQWDTVLTRHLQEKLDAQSVCLVLVAPYEPLFSTDELQDWEREDYVEYSLRHLKGLAAAHRVPVVLSVDMAVWARAHPLLAWKAYEAAASRWSVHRSGDGWRAVEVGTEHIANSGPRRQRTLSDFAPAGWPQRAAPLVATVAGRSDPPRG